MRMVFWPGCMFLLKFAWCMTSFCDMAIAFLSPLFSWLKGDPSEKNKVWPVSSRRRALEHSLSVAPCLPSCWPANVYVLVYCAAISGSEMEWDGLVSLVWASRLSVRYEMNGLFYTSIVPIEMNVVVSTSVVRRFEGGNLPWVHCYFVELFRWGAVVLWGLWVAGLFHVLALFPNDIVIRLIRCFCDKVVHFCVVQSDVWAIWVKPCLRHLIAFPFLLYSL